MSKAYNEAVEMSFVLWDSVSKGDPIVEQLVAMGYRAGLQDAAKALNEGAAGSRVNDAPLRLYGVVREKLAAVARKFEERAKELKV